MQTYQIYYKYTACIGHTVASGIPHSIIVSVSNFRNLRFLVEHIRARGLVVIAVNFENCTCFIRVYDVHTTHVLCIELMSIHFVRGQRKRKIKRNGINQTEQTTMFGNNVQMSWMWLRMGTAVRGLALWGCSQWCGLMGGAGAGVNTIRYRYTKEKKRKK